MPLNALRAFEAVGRLRGVTAAASELHVTPSAVSHHLRTLEDWIGTELFAARTREMTLTDAGRRLSEAASVALGDLARTCARLRGRPTLSVGCIASIASRWLVPNLDAFARRRPDIALRVVYARADEAMADSGNDVLVTLGEDRSPRVAQRRLFSRISRPVCSPHFLAAHGPLDGPAAIAAAPLLHDESTDGWRDWFREAGVAGRQFEKGPIFADFNLLATAAIAGHGVALCPVEVFRDEVIRGDLVVVSEIATNRDKAYFLSIAADATPAALAFADWFGALLETPA